MNAHEKADALARAVRGAYSINNQTIEDWGVDLWVDDLMKYPLQGSMEALRDAARAGRMPSLASVCNRLEGRLDARDEALEIVDRIFHSISQIGSYRAADARAHIGEIGWSAILSYGGWESLCNVQDKEVPTIRAQIRDSVKASIARSKAGPERTSLPPAQERLGLTSASDVLGTLLPMRGRKPA